MRASGGPSPGPDFPEAGGMSRRCVLSGIGAVVLFTCVVSCADHAVIESAGNAGIQTSEELIVPDPDPALVQGTLSNGFRYVLFHNTTPRNRVSMHLDVQVGSMQERDNETGVAHYLEHMLFNGSTHFKPGELVEYFQSIGMRFGPDANAHTSFTETVYDILLPQGTRDELEKGLLVLSDYAEGALLLESEVQREKGVILAEKRERDSVNYRTLEKTLAFELPGSKVPERLPIGKDDVIKGADRALLKRFYDAWYRPDTMVLVMVGDFDPGVAEELIRERFSGMKARGWDDAAPKDAWVPHSGVKTLYHYEPEAGKTDVSIQTVLARPMPDDTVGSIRQRFVHDIAAELLQHRLTRLVRQNKAPFSDAGMFAGQFLQDVHFSVLTAESSPDRWEETLTALEKNLRQALQYGFSDSELARVKADRRQELDTAVKEASTRKTSPLARALIRQINRKRVFLSPDQERDLLKPCLESLSVEDVNHAFRELWSADHRLIEVTGNAVIDSSVRVPELKISQVYDNSISQEVTSPGDHEKIAFPYLPEPENGFEILSSRVLPDIGVSLVDYANQVRLNYKQTTFSKSEFTFRVNFGTGRSGEPVSLPGISILCQGVINTGGFGGMTRNQMEEALAGTNVSIGFGVDEDTFFLYGSAGSSEIDLVCQLIRTYFLDPGFSPEALELTKARYRQMYQEKIRTPDGLMEIRGSRLLASGDSRFGLPDIDSIDAIDINAVASWMKPYFETGPIELSIVGDVATEDVMRSVSSYLGTLPERGVLPEKEIRKNPAFPEAGSFEIAADTKIENARISISFPTADFWDIQRTRGLNILAAVLSERLRLTIRENLGEAYSPFAYNDPSRAYGGYGVMSVIVDVDPNSLEQVVKAVDALSGSMAADGVDAREVELAVGPVLTHIRDMMATNDYWLQSVLAGSLRHPEKLDWPVNIMEGYSSITDKDVSALARHYLKKDKSVCLTIMPLPNG